MTLDQMNFLVFPMEMPWFGCPFPPLKMYKKKKKKKKSSERLLVSVGVGSFLMRTPWFHVCMYVCLSFLSIPKRMSILKTLVCVLPKLTL